MNSFKHWQCSVCLESACNNMANRRHLRAKEAVAMLYPFNGKRVYEDEDGELFSLVSTLSC